MKILDTTNSNYVYGVYIYVMNETYDTIETCICVDNFENIKSYFINKYKDSPLVYGMHIYSIGNNLTDFWMEGF